MIVIIDGDGLLSLGEHKLTPAPDGAMNAAMRVLDLDGSGTLSADEFQAEGRMVYAFNQSDDSVVGHEGESLPMTFVEFMFTPEKTRVSTYADARINTGQLDRAVIWYDDGSHARFEGDVEIVTTPDGNLTFYGKTATFPPSVSVSEPEDGTVTATRTLQ